MGINQIDDLEQVTRLLGEDSERLPKIRKKGSALVGDVHPRDPLGIAAAVTLPLVALITLAVRERWRDGRAEVRRYFILRKTGDVRGRLLERRRELAVELEKLRREISGEG